MKLNNSKKKYESLQARQQVKILRIQVCFSEIIVGILKGEKDVRLVIINSIVVQRFFFSFNNALCQILFPLHVNYFPDSNVKI